MPVVPSVAVVAALSAVSDRTLVTHDMYIESTPSPIPLKKIREIPGPNASLDAAISAQIKVEANQFDEKTSHNVIFGMSDSEIFYVHENPQTNRFYVVTSTNIFLHPVIAGTITATDFFLIAKDFATLNDHPTVVDPEMHLRISSTMFKGITIGIFQKGTVYKAYRTLNNLSIIQEYNAASTKPVRSPLSATVTNPLINTLTNLSPSTVTNPLINTLTNPSPSAVTNPLINTVTRTLAPTVTPTTLPCSTYIEDYNTNTVVGSGATKNEKITCAPEVSDAKSKLTIKLTSSLLPPDQVTFSDVGIEQKDDKWSGFFLDLKAATGTRWIRIDVSGKKLKYTIQYNEWYGSWVQKEVEVKFDKDNTYTFDGGTVQFKGTDPFKSEFPIGLIVGLSVGGVLLLIVVVVIIVKFTPKGRELQAIIKSRIGGLRLPRRGGGFELNQSSENFESTEH
jgi:hypothetical protein